MKIYHLSVRHTKMRVIWSIWKLEKNLVLWNTCK